MKESKQVIITGVGGQGNILLARVIATATLMAGYDVRVGELYGSAQRGGPVVSYVKYGDKIYSPIIESGAADAIISLEIGETLRRLSLLKPQGTVIINNYSLIPTEVSIGKAKYPTLEEVISIVGKVAGNICVVPATQSAVELGEVRATNIVMLGVFAHVFNSGIPMDYFITAIKENVPAKYVDINIKAFEKGGMLARDLCLRIP
ncbi:MAG: indolepyruvate oxidoreductase subunit beta [Desulfurococcaceae archaeon]